MWYAFVKKIGVTKGVGGYSHLDLVDVLIDPQHNPTTWVPTDMEDAKNPKGLHKNFVWVKGNNMTAAELDAIRGVDPGNPAKKGVKTLDTTSLTAKQIADAGDITKTVVVTTSKGAVANFTKAKV